MASQLFVLDTNILVAYVRAGALGRWIESAYHLRSIANRPLISVVTEGEALSLAKKFQWGAEKEQALQALLSQFVIVGLEAGDDIVRAYAEIDHYSDTVGRPMGKNDVWIAATARATDAVLLTADQDFDHLHPSWITRDWVDTTVVGYCP